MNEPHKIRILIADDHSYTVEGFKSILSHRTEYEVVGTASDGEQVLALLQRKPVDIILMDIRMPVLDGIETTRIVREKFPSVKILGVSGYDDEDNMFLMLNTGVKGLVLKSSETSEIHRAIDNIYQGGEYFCSKSIPILFRKMINASSISSEMAAYSGYSKTEVKVIKEICRQKTSKEISETLLLSEKTISYYRHRLMEKMNVKSSIGIVLYAIKGNLINIKDVI